MRISTNAQGYDDTIGDVRAAMDRQRGGKALRYEIRTAFPPVTYADDAQTLREAGLVPNAALVLHAK